MTPDDLAYLEQREAAERAAAEESACMARTAHEDLADEYADRAAAMKREAARAEAEILDLIRRLA